MALPYKFELSHGSLAAINSPKKARKLNRFDDFDQSLVPSVLIYTWWWQRLDLNQCIDSPFF